MHKTRIQSVNCDGMHIVGILCVEKNLIVEQEVLHMNQVGLQGFSLIVIVMFLYAFT